MHTLAPGLDWFGRFLDRDVRTGFDPPVLRRRGPLHGVLQDLLHGVVVIDRVGFMPGPEVKDVPVSAFPGLPGSEDFAAGEPADEKLFVRRGNDEGLAIHFGVLNFKISIDSPGDRSLSLTFTRLLDRTDINYRVQAADSLEGSWAVIGEIPGGGVPIARNGGSFSAGAVNGNTQEITFSDSVRVEDAAARFMRIEILRHP